MWNPFTVHYGVVKGVTGSCHQLQMGGELVLPIDCGFFQGAETSPEGRAGGGKLAIDFSFGDIKALVTIHVHIDHVGRIPCPLAAGFKGSIFCSESSAKQLTSVLEDAFKLGFSCDQKQVERYLTLIEQHIVTSPYKQWTQLNARICLQRAGHILDLACVEVDLHYSGTGDKKRIVFSGDLVAPYASILPALKAPYKADVLVIESTYGDHLHENRRSRRARREYALSGQGTVMIPIFSIGRTQELLYELEGIIHHRALSAKVQPYTLKPSSSKATAFDWANLPKIFDSLLTSRFTMVYREFNHFWDVDARAQLVINLNPLAFRSLLTVDSYQAHLAMVDRLAQAAQLVIVIAGNLMCFSGRIVSYLTAMLGHARHEVLFDGCQAEGALGRQILRLIRMAVMWNLAGSAMPFGLKCIPWAGVQLMRVRMTCSAS